MKVLDLRCGQGHAFEGWFGSEDEFQRQLGAQMVSCPMCGNTAVSKCLSAPRLNLGGSKPPEHPQEDASSLTMATTPNAQAHLLQALRQWVAQADDVGGNFADQARQMHLGELPERSIRGQASAQQARELMEEGVPVLPLPDILKARLH